MSEKPTNNIDDIFRRSVDNHETEPSEGFWIKASEDMLFKSNLAKRSELVKWRTVAAVLGAAIVVLGLYVGYTQKQIADIKKQLANEQRRTVVNQVPENKASQSVNSSKAISQPIVSQTQNKPVTNTNAVAVDNTVGSSTQHNVVAVKGLSKTSVINGSTAKQYAVNSTNDAQSTNTQQPVVSTPIQPNTTNEQVSSDSIEQVNASENVNTSTQNINQNNVQQIAETSSQATSTDAANTKTTDNAVTANSIQPSVADNKSNTSKFSVAIYYAPFLRDELFENDGADISTVNNVTSMEEEYNPYIVGARIGYDISSRLTVITGLYFYNYSAQLNPVTVYAQQNSDGQIAYSMKTNLGYVVCPTDDKHPTAGDAIQVNGKEEAAYISIPLQARYNFGINHKLSFSLTAGTILTMNTSYNARMHWCENRTQGDAAGEIQSMKRLYGSFLFAPGVSYRFFKGFSFFAEPSIMLMPSFLGGSGSSSGVKLVEALGGGLTYHL